MGCLSFQTMKTPDGLMFSLYGPEVERRHDITLLRGSLINELVENCLNSDEQQYYIYGDDDYVLRPCFKVEHDRRTATTVQKLLNTGMSTIRETVEWG